MVFLGGSTVEDGQSDVEMMTVVGPLIAKSIDELVSW
jgi:hypothetical protein